MSLHCGLHMQVKPGAIVSFSGALLVHKTLQNWVSQQPLTRNHLHQISPTPSPACAWHRGYGGAICADEEAQSILEEKGVEVEAIARPGLAHGIDPDGLTAAIDF